MSILTIDQVWNTVEQLPIDQQDQLAKLIREKQDERYAAELFAELAQSKKDLAEGRIKAQSAEEAIAELNNYLDSDEDDDE